LIDPVYPTLLARLDIVREPADLELSEDDNGVLVAAYGANTLAVGTADGRTLLYHIGELNAIAEGPKEAACARTAEGLSAEDWHLPTRDPTPENLRKLNHPGATGLGRNFPASSARGPVAAGRTTDTLR